MTPSPSVAEPSPFARAIDRIEVLEARNAELEGALKQFMDCLFRREERGILMGKKDFDRFYDCARALLERQGV
jgi:hypothetical protein